MREICRLFCLAETVKNFICWTFGHLGVNYMSSLRFLTVSEAQALSFGASGLIIERNTSIEYSLFRFLDLHVKSINSVIQTVDKINNRHDEIAEGQSQRIVEIL